MAKADRPSPLHLQPNSCHPAAVKSNPNPCRCQPEHSLRIHELSTGPSRSHKDPKNRGTRRSVPGHRTAPLVSPYNPSNYLYGLFADRCLGNCGCFDVEQQPGCARAIPRGDRPAGARDRVSSLPGSWADEGRRKGRRNGRCREPAGRTGTVRDKARSASGDGAGSACRSAASPAIHSARCSTQARASVSRRDAGATADGGNAAGSASTGPGPTRSSSAAGSKAPGGSTSCCT